MALVYHLGLREFVAVAKQILPGASLGPDVLDHARLSLDMPAAERRGAPEADRLVFSTVPEQAAVMTCSLLVDPPIPAEPVRIAAACLDRFLAHNSARFTVDRTVANLRFQQVVRDRSGAHDLMPWIASNVAIEVLRPAAQRRRKRARGDVCLEQPPLFEPLNERRAYLVVYLAGPLSSLTPDERRSLAPLNRAIKRGLERARRKLGSRLELRLKHPSLDLPDIEPHDAWEYNSREIAEGVDGLILTDVAMKSAAFGAALELDLLAAQDGPALYLRDPACSEHSNYLHGRLAELDMEVRDYAGDSELTRLVCDWVVRRAGALATAARRRDDRAIQYAPMHSKLVTAWTNSNDLRKGLAADAAGMTVDAVNRMLTSVVLTTSAPAHRLDSLSRRLGVKHGAELPRAAARQEGRGDVSGLFQAAEHNAWDLDLVRRLWHAALEQERQPHAHAVRRRLISSRDWERFHDEVFVRNR